MPGLQALPLPGLPLWKVNVPSPETAAGVPAERIPLKNITKTDPRAEERKQLDMKKSMAFLLALALTLSLTACGGNPEAPIDAGAEPVELMVFAAASLTETLTEIGEQYRAVAPAVTLTFNFASSGDLLTQIQEGADCDLFLSAAQKQMDALDGALAGDGLRNPGGLDLLAPGSRVDLLENKVVLAVPEGNPRGVGSFDQLAEALGGEEPLLLAIGNSDVPVGQYTLKILEYYGLSEAALNGAGVLTYGSNVKEVTTQVGEAAVDCGIIYATDAFSAGLEVVDRATAEMCGQVIYPAAVLREGRTEAAQAFLDYLQTDAAMAVFESVGFSPAGAPPRS